MKTNDELKKPFKDNSFDMKRSIYIDILSNDEKIKSERELLDVLKEKFPDDSSVNLSRVGRELREIVKAEEMGTNDKPIITIRKWMKKYHIDTRIKDMLHDIKDFSKSDMDVFLKVEPYQAALLGQIIRESFEDCHCFVVSDYDTVLVHFGEKEKYEDFLNLCKNFMPDFTKNEKSPRNSGNILQALQRKKKRERQKNSELL